MELRGFWVYVLRCDTTQRLLLTIVQLLQGGLGVTAFVSP